MTQAELHTRAMLVSLRISSWSARKYDRKVSMEATAAHGATLDAGRFNKHLLPGDAPTYKALNSHVAAVRQGNYDQTLPWSDDGWRILTVKNFDHYTDIMRKWKHEFDRLLAEFRADYPALRMAAKDKLNGMYKDDDYPADIRDRYSFAVEYNPVPTGTDFRVTIADDEINAIAARTEERVRESFEAAHQDAVKRLYACVQHIQARLSEPDAIFRDSLISNARELCDILTRINVTDDPALERMRRETELLATAEPETLRKDDKARLETANRAQTILASMQATYGKGIFA
jgi:hypothetical protein